MAVVMDTSTGFLLTADLVYASVLILLTHHLLFYLENPWQMLVLNAHNLLLLSHYEVRGHYSQLERVQVRLRPGKIVTVFDQSTMHYLYLASSTTTSDK